jgi:hypothetical protein
VVTGPYFCVDDDGSFFGGCQAEPCQAGQNCSTDKAGDEFCSLVCASDSSCGNPGVACCNAECQDGGMCCGLCGS